MAIELESSTVITSSGYERCWVIDDERAVIEGFFDEGKLVGQSRDWYLTELQSREDISVLCRAYYDGNDVATAARVIFRTNGADGFRMDTAMPISLADLDMLRREYDAIIAGRELHKRIYVTGEFAFVKLLTYPNVEDRSKVSVHWYAERESKKITTDPFPWESLKPMEITGYPSIRSPGIWTSLLCNPANRRHAEMASLPIGVTLMKGTRVYNHYNV